MAGVFNPNTTRNIIEANVQRGNNQNLNNPHNNANRNNMMNNNNNNDDNPNNNNNNADILSNRGGVVGGANGANSNQPPQSKGPPSVFVLTEPPRRVPLVFLSEPWLFPLFSYTCDGADAWLEALCCHRCHTMGQLDALRNIPKPEEVDEFERRGWRLPANPRPLPFWFVPCMVCLDAATAGNPIGIGWSGIGSALWGCHLRTRIRKKYRIQGSGMDDLLVMACCSAFAARQHERELLHHELYYVVPWGCCVNDRVERRRMIGVEAREMV